MFNGIRNWNGLVSPASTEDTRERLISPNRVVYLDSMFTAGYEKVVKRLISPVIVQECGGKNLQIRIEKAVWDTGASMSCISEELAKQEGMRPVATGAIVTLAGQKDALYYLLDIHLSEAIVIKNVRVAAVSMVGRDSDFVIGMDVISKGDLSIKNKKGKTEICFEYNE